MIFLPLKQPINIIIKNLYNRIGANVRLVHMFIDDFVTISLKPSSKS